MVDREQGVSGDKSKKQTNKQTVFFGRNQK